MKRVNSRPAYLVRAQRQSAQVGREKPSPSRLPTRYVNSRSGMAEQCERKIALLEELKKAVADLIELHNRGIDVLLADDFDALRPRESAKPA